MHTQSGEHAQSAPAKTVVVGLSGGVDSSVVAALLKEQGYDVIGLFMKNWDEKDENGVCQASKDFEDVARVCEKLDIPYYSVDFIEEYRKQVFDDFLSQYERGYTPNPDVLCNREIKFKAFFEKAMQFGADYLATGHYCQIGRMDGKAVLAKGADPSKDQSYFLAEIPGEVLERVLFPIGHLLKTEVREIAKRHGLATAAKKDSTGICFIGERNFQPFLSQYLRTRKGPMMTLSGEVVGEHSGTVFYTLGQRKGLGLGGQGEPWFVLKKDFEKNIVYVDRGEEHPALYAEELTALAPHWILPAGVVAPDASRFPMRVTAKVRYRQPDQDCTLYLNADGTLRVVFDRAQRAITPGQYAVFYLGAHCLGGAVIDSVGESMWERKNSGKNVGFPLLG